MTVYALLILMAASPPLSASAEATRLFETGNALYAEGDAAGAVTAYGAAVESGWEAVELYLNLSLAALEAGDFGTARVAAERAARMAPSSGDVLTVVGAIRGVTTGQEPGMAAGATLPTGREEAVVVGALVLWFLALTILAAAVWIRWRPMRVAGAIATICAVVAVAVALRVSVEEARPFSVVMPPSAELRAGPESAAEVTATLHAGSLLSVERRSGSWLGVRSEDGAEGWIPEALTVDV